MTFSGGTELLCARGEFYSRPPWIQHCYPQQFVEAYTKHKNFLTSWLVECSLPSRRCVKHSSQIPLKHTINPSIPVIQIFAETACSQQEHYGIREFRVHDPVALATVPSENLAQPKNRSNELINHAVSIFVSLGSLPCCSSWPLKYKNGTEGFIE